MAFSSREALESGEAYVLNSCWYREEMEYQDMKHASNSRTSYFSAF
jgi:hypothetical protein